MCFRLLVIFCFTWWPWSLYSYLDLCALSFNDVENLHLWCFMAKAAWLSRLFANQVTHIHIQHDTIAYLVGHILSPLLIVVQMCTTVFQHFWKQCIVIWKRVDVAKIPSLSLTAFSAGSFLWDTTIGQWVVWLQLAVNNSFVRYMLLLLLLWFYRLKSSINFGTLRTVSMLLWKCSLVECIAWFQNSSLTCEGSSSVLDVIWLIRFERANHIILLCFSKRHNKILFLIIFCFWHFNLTSS